MYNNLLLTIIAKSDVTLQKRSLIDKIHLYDEYYKEPGPGEQSIAECIVAKNRHGSTGTVKLAWIGQYTKFLTQDVEHADE